MPRLGTLVSACIFLLQGVMLSHRAVIGEVAGLHAFLKQIGEGTTVTEKDVVLSYLPLAHIFDRCVVATRYCRSSPAWLDTRMLRANAHALISSATRVAQTWEGHFCMCAGNC